MRRRETKRGQVNETLRRTRSASEASAEHSPRSGREPSVSQHLTELSRVLALALPTGGRIGVDMKDIH